MKPVKEFVVHFKNPKRNNRTICGHDYTIPGRTYANITTRVNDVTCKACLNRINERKKKVMV